MTVLSGHAWPAMEELPTHLFSFTLSAYVIGSIQAHPIYIFVRSPGFSRSGPPEGGTPNLCAVFIARSSGFSRFLARRKTFATAFT